MSSHTCTTWSRLWQLMTFYFVTVYGGAMNWMIRMLWMSDMEIIAYPTWWMPASWLYSAHTLEMVFDSVSGILWNHALLRRISQSNNNTNWLSQCKHCRLSLSCSGANLWNPQQKKNVSTSFHFFILTSVGSHSMRSWHVPTMWSMRFSGFSGCQKPNESTWFAGPCVNVPLGSTGTSVMTFPTSGGLSGVVFAGI